MPKILILEDDPTLLELLQQFLGFEGYDVVALHHFDNIMEDLQSHQPDGVILDIQLADKNGLDILDELRAEKKLDQIYILASSGLDYSSEAIQRGANDFIMKPYMPDDLAKLLRKNIEQ